MMSLYFDRDAEPVSAANECRVDGSDKSGVVGAALIADFHRSASYQILACSDGVEDFAGQILGVSDRRFWWRVFPDESIDSLFQVDYFRVGR